MAKGLDGSGAASGEEDISEAMSEESGAAAMNIGSDIPKTIIFCTRTHSQINQIFEEIKNKLPYRLRISPFASRKQSCIYEDLA